MSREFFFRRRRESERFVGVAEVHFGKLGKKFCSAFLSEFGGAEIDLFSGSFRQSSSSEFAQILQSAQKSGACNDGGRGNGHVAFRFGALDQMNF